MEPISPAPSRTACSLPCHTTMSGTWGAWQCESCSQPTPQPSVADPHPTQPGSHHSCAAAPAPAHPRSPGQHSWGRHHHPAEELKHKARFVVFKTHFVIFTTTETCSFDLQSAPILCFSRNCFWNISRDFSFKLPL